MDSPSEEKVKHDGHPDLEHYASAPVAGGVFDANEEHEVFKTTAGVNFRTVEWPRATVIFLKVIFAVGVLTIPTALYDLGAVGGTLSVFGWGLLNTWAAVIQGDFRNNHRGCHSIADMANEVGGPICREITGALFIVAYVLLTGSGILGVSIAFNVFSGHAVCTNWFSFVAMILVVAAASFRKMSQIGWLTWAGFASVFIAVFIVVVAVTQVDRPAAAPQTGDYELGFAAIAYPSFAAGMVATCSIFVSYAGTSAFLPVISEMREPRDFRKSLYLCMAIVIASYVSFSLVVYRYCGAWVAVPSLGSAGPTIKIVAYAVGFMGLLVSGCLYLHVGAKYVFVRILRNSEHLQADTWVHWTTWLGCTGGLGAIAFILAQAIPIFNYLLSLTGSLCFAPIALSLPGWLWCHDNIAWRRGKWWQQIVFWITALMIPLGMFICVGGTYGVVVEIKEAYASGRIGSAFSCEDNSGTTAS
ncbi:hypothetical protein WHR41_07541 [Cladosporium halotolerans]|uniref:Amino acid transporter transmembrane domain-containing protein n=1 Tax=Cladosporium halotolerans TaxID=1052096 RepID=A0AB34KG38_9PEZI